MEGVCASANTIMVSTNTVKTGFNTCSPASTIDVNGSAQIGSSGSVSTITASGYISMASGQGISISSGIFSPNGSFNFGVTNQIITNRENYLNLGKEFVFIENVQDTFGTQTPAWTVINNSNGEATSRYQRQQAGGGPGSAWLVGLDRAHANSSCYPYMIGLDQNFLSVFISSDNAVDIGGQNTCYHPPVQLQIEGTGNFQWGTTGISTGTSSGNLVLATGANISAAYIQSQQGGSTTGGVVRMGNAETIDWRNGAGSGNNAIGTNSNNQLIWNGGIIATGGGAVNLGNVSGTIGAANGGVTATIPTNQIFTSGSGTYTTPANVLWLRVRMIGGGGGGGANGSSGQTAGGAGGDTTFSSFTAGKGSGGAAGSTSGTTSGGAGGTVSGCSAVNIPGDAGGNGGAIVAPGGSGGNGVFGGGGEGGQSGINGTAGATNTGGGGGGAGGGGAVFPGAGGGSGAYCETIIGSPAGTYSYGIGAGGSGGSAGVAGGSGQAGGSGYITVEEHYNY